MSCLRPSLLVPVVVSLWVPLFLCELLYPYRLRHFLASPTLAKGLALSALVALGAGAAVAALSHLAGRSTRARGAADTGVATAILASALVVVGAAPIHAVAVALSLDRITGAVALVVAACAVAPDWRPLLSTRLLASAGGVRCSSFSAFSRSAPGSGVS